jgi:hypothetical protein
MSASGGDCEGHVSLLPEKQRCTERNGGSRQWRHENNSRVPRHQIEPGIKRALPVITKPGLGVFLNAHGATPVRSTSAAARGSARGRARPERRVQKREREQHQQRNGGESPQAIMVAQSGSPKYDLRNARHVNMKELHSEAADSGWRVALAFGPKRLPRTKKKGT